MENIVLRKRWIFLFAGFVVFGGSTSILRAQTLASRSQQIAAMKTLKPGLKSIGVMASTLTDNDLQEITRYGLGQGVEMVFARPKDSRDISMLYKKMVEEKKVQMIWIPDPNDATMLEAGFEFLRENTLLDKIGLCVPKEQLIQSGALCGVYKDIGKVVVHVNQKIASVLGVVIPQEPGSITYVVQ